MSLQSTICQFVGYLISRLISVCFFLLTPRRASFTESLLHIDDSTMMYHNDNRKGSSSHNIHCNKFIQRNEEGKDQESIQSNTTPDLGKHLGK